MIAESSAMSLKSGLNHGLIFLRIDSPLSVIL